ncbi:hypothetical protein [Chryseolinea lacunae]|uniref:Cell wall anchor protein n=1 Tax=Chryseolinea lacunae TaxID=2801331 RepID=A0ABS1KMP7_9BACT|nr:hypothetical protein [Chryseolinea lacunae]MBL0740740.1 hypothetical protein [Chryseolinea lacunae]
MKIIAITLLSGLSFTCHGQWSTTGSDRIRTDYSVGIGPTEACAFMNSNQAAAPTYDGPDKVLTISAAAPTNTTYEGRPILEFARNVNNYSNGAKVGGIYFTNSGGQKDQHRQVAGIWSERTSYSVVPNGVGARLVFMTKRDGAGVQNKMTFDQDGNLGIGVADTKGYKLAVAGKAVAEEVVVKLQGSWPDYVFEGDYKIPTLLELNAFIQQHKHLPGVPSQSDIAQVGINLGNMDAVLLKKIEELTLYVIELKNDVERLKEENEKLTSSYKK